VLLDLARRGNRENSRFQSITQLVFFPSLGNFSTKILIHNLHTCVILLSNIFRNLEERVSFILVGSKYLADGPEVVSVAIEIFKC
jgi:hypothetical protein